MSLTATEKEGLKNFATTWVPHDIPKIQTDKALRRWLAREIFLALVNAYDDVGFHIGCHYEKGDSDEYSGSTAVELSMVSEYVDSREIDIANEWRLEIEYRGSDDDWEGYEVLCLGAENLADDLKRMAALARNRAPKIAARNKRRAQQLGEEAERRRQKLRSDYKAAVAAAPNQTIYVNPSIARDLLAAGVVAEAGPGIMTLNVEGQK